MNNLIERVEDRTWIIVCYVSIAAVFVTAAAGGNESILRLVALILAVFTMYSAYAIVKGNAHRIMNAEDKTLDEREITFRNRAFRQAYIGLVAIITLLMVYWYIASDTGRLWMPTEDLQLAATFWSVWLISFTLPDAVYAFSVPKPLLEEQPE